MIDFGSEMAGTWRRSAASNSLSNSLVALEKSAAFGGSGAAGASQRASVSSANFSAKPFSTDC